MSQASEGTVGILSFDWDSDWLSDDHANNEAVNANNCIEIIEMVFVSLISFLNKIK